MIIKLTYYPILDSFLSELKWHFSEKNKNIMKSLQACCPTSDNFLNIDHLETTYDLKLEVIGAEIKVAKCTLLKKELEDITDVLIELVPLKEAFPELLHLLQLH